MRNYIRNIWMAVLNRYEAGQLGSRGGRSHIPAYVQDARFDADSATRLEILRKARYWERNNAIVNRLADIFEQYTVGGGLPITPASSDPDWNTRAKAYWDESCRLLNLCNLQHFASDQSLIARTWFIEGEVFILKTGGSEGRPRIKLIDSHRVGGSGLVSEFRGRNIIDGVEIDSNGRPIAYWIQNGVNDSDFTRVDAENIIHIFEPSRIAQYRGISFLHAVLNDIHDLDDLQILEQKAAREGAETTNVLNNSAGELTAEQVRGQRYQVKNQNSAGADVTENRTEFFRRAVGGRTVVLKTGEKFEQFKSERPSVATQGYWDFLASKICAGVGITKQLVFPWSMQGTVTRADLDVAAQFFRTRSCVLQNAFTEVYRYVMFYGTKQDRTIQDPPFDWRNVTMRAPKAPNVDVGRNSSAILAELRAGATTLEKIYGEQGMDWMTQIRQRAKEVRAIHDIAEELQIPPVEVSEFIAEQITAEAAPQPTL